MKNILIVEDDQFTVDFYKFIFKKAGFNTLVLEDGDKVIETLSDVEVHLIIMDINLKNTYLNGSKIDGIKLTQKIKTNPNFERVPVLLVTAYQPDLKNGNFLTESLAEDYIVKPIIDFNALIEKVNSLINI